MIKNGEKSDQMDTENDQKLVKNWSKDDRKSSKMEKKVTRWTPKMIKNWSKSDEK